MKPFTVIRYQGHVYYLNEAGTHWLLLVYHCIDCSDDGAIPVDQLTGAYQVLAAAV